MIAASITLILYAIGGIAVAVFMAVRMGRVLNFRTLLIANYVLVELISGVVHLVGNRGGYRGFFDVLTGGAPALSSAVLGSVFGLIALCVGCLWKLPTGRGDMFPSMSGPERWLAGVSALLVLPLAWIGVSYMQSYAATSGAVRVLAVDEGAARYVFLSHWAVWAISLTALVLMFSRPFRAPGTRLVIVMVATGLSVSSLAWTGGRSIIVVMALPLFLVAAPTLRRWRWPAVAALAVAGVAYIGAVTAQRTTGTRVNSSVESWLDWEWGRFSMLGFAGEYVDSNGFLHGETFLAAIANVVLGIIRLVGVYIPNPTLRSMPQITGETLLGTTDTYVVAGYVGELFLNFGVMGVAIGCLLLALLTSWVDTRFVSSRSAVIKLFWAYVGTLLVFRTLAADANAFGSYLLYSGLPLLVVALIARSALSRPVHGRFSTTVEN